MREFTDANFQDEVLGNDKPVLVDFWAPWCGPCKALSPTVEKLAAEYDGRMVIGKMDIQAHPAQAGQLGIRSIPALLFFKDGAVAESLMGVVNEDRLRDRIDAVLE